MKRKRGTPGTGNSKSCPERGVPGATVCVAGETRVRGGLSPAGRGKLQRKQQEPFNSQ